jgi:hypothetical protein
MTGRGVVCYISNFSYLSDPSFVMMRKRFLDEFDGLWFDCLNGDSRETGKLTPEGEPDPSVFSTERNREGIRVGTAVGLMVRRAERQQPRVQFRNFWGANKRADLVASLKTEEFEYEGVTPDENARYSFRPSDVTVHYSEWPRAVELCAESPSNGLMEKRRGALIDIDRAALEARMRAYFDKGLDWRGYAVLGHGLSHVQARFDPRKAREKAQAAENYSDERLVRYSIRPFDVQWCYYTGVRPVWNEPRPSLWAQLWPGNGFLLTRVKAEKSPEGVPFFFTPCLSDDHFLAPDAVAIPFRVVHSQEDDGHHGRIKARDDAPTADPVANLSLRTRAYLEHLGVRDWDRNLKAASAIWLHTLAVAYSPQYLAENADGIRRDWPRIPLPASRDALLASAQLGEELAALLNTEVDVNGITGAVRPEVKVIGNITPVQGKMIDPATDLEIDAGWGHEGKDGAIMPGRGKLVERDYTSAERDAIAKRAELLGPTLDQALVQLGTTTCDVFLNARAYWKNVPKNVWEYYIGGYQVMKKWLSYREAKLLGRPISPEEARYVSQMASRIAAICLLQPKLDANYVAVKSNTYAWPK